MNQLRDPVPINQQSRVLIFTTGGLSYLIDQIGFRGDIKMVVTTINYKIPTADTRTHILIFLLLTTTFSLGAPFSANDLSRNSRRTSSTSSCKF